MTESAVSAPKKGGQPKFTVEQVIAAIHKARGMISPAARALGCDPDTVRNYAKRHPTVAAALTEEREQTTDIAELALYRAIEGGEAWAVCFYLKTQGKARGYVERHELDVHWIEQAASEVAAQAGVSVADVMTEFNALVGTKER